MAEITALSVSRQEGSGREGETEYAGEQCWSNDLQSSRGDETYCTNVWVALGENSLSKQKRRGLGQMQVTGYMWDELSKTLFCLLFSPQINKKQGSQAESEHGGRDDRSLRKTRNGMVMYKTGMDGLRTYNIYNRWEVIKTSGLSEHKCTVKLASMSVLISAGL